MKFGHCSFMGEDWISMDLPERSSSSLGDLLLGAMLAGGRVSHFGGLVPFLAVFFRRHTF